MGLFGLFKKKAPTTSSTPSPEKNIAGKECKDVIITDAVNQLAPGTRLIQASVDEDAEISFKLPENFQTFAAKNIEGACFFAKESTAQILQDTLQQKLGKGYVVYVSEKNYGTKADKITILITHDKFDALRFEGTNGLNYDIYTEDIIANLQELEKTNPFILTGAGTDFVQGDFLESPGNAEELAVKMYEFCPDIVDQGVGSVEELAESLEIMSSFYYWWD